MQIYFSPELIKQETQILNVVDQHHKAVGYVALIVADKKVYVYGTLEQEGVEEDFKDLVKPYLTGIAKAYPETEIYSFLAVGGKKVELETK